MLFAPPRERREVPWENVEGCLESGTSLAQGLSANAARCQCLVSWEGTEEALRGLQAQGSVRPCVGLEAHWGLPSHQLSPWLRTCALTDACLFLMISSPTSAWGEACEGTQGLREGAWSLLPTTFGSSNMEAGRWSKGFRDDLELPVVPFRAGVPLVVLGQG